MAEVYYIICKYMYIHINEAIVFVMLYNSNNTVRAYNYIKKKTLWN